jgi:putative spermidine/putrescine transport system ATP-binding protein
MEPIEKLQLQGITRRFGTTAALTDFNLEIPGGTFVTLLGPSGCGKTTALNCLAGLLELSEGRILLNQKPIEHVPAEKRGFGMVFQNYALFPHLTVFCNVSYGLEIRGVPKLEREKRVRDALARVHLDAFETRFPAQLSGGQQQRLAFARTIVLEPQLLLLDEPLSNLDANLRNEMRVEIKRLHEELHLTTVYVTHDQVEALSMSDHVVVMRQGSIEQAGTPQEIYTRPQSLFVAHFMGYANRLPVTILDHVNERFLVQTETGITLRASAVGKESSNWQIGQQVIACFRPDETLTDSPALSNQLQGRAHITEYIGKAFEILVRLEGNEDTQLFVYSQQYVESGSSISFSIRPERLLLFPTTDMLTANIPSARLSEASMIKGGV